MSSETRMTVTREEDGGTRGYTGHERGLERYKVGGVGGDEKSRKANQQQQKPFTKSSHFIS